MKNIIQIASVFFFSLLTIAAIGQSRDIGNFTAIKASSSVSVKLVKADSPGIEYKMIRGSESDLITTVKGNTLVVKIKSNNSWNWKKSSQAKVIVYYTQLDDISVSAGASLKSEDVIVSSSMDVDVSSGASATLEIETNDLDADVSSGATLKLSGSANKGDFDASSGASMVAGNMICNHVIAEASSGASVTVHADKSFDADASSGGSIKYKGNAESSKVDTGWSGQIRKI